MATNLTWSSLAAYAYLRDFGTDRVAGVVVVDQPPEELGRGRRHDELGGVAAAAGGPARLPARRDRRPPRALDVHDPTHARAGPDDAEVGWMVEAAMRLLAEAAALVLMDGTTSDFSAVAERTSDEIPTLVFGSMPALGPARAWVAAHMPKSEFAPTPTHLGFYVDPDGFNARLDRFLASLQCAVPHL